MARYFLSIGYKGTRYAGFQKQQNAHTVQAEVEQALRVFFREEILLTGSSRTDTGVHARENYFHFDHTFSQTIDFEKSRYHLNAILPNDIVVHQFYAVAQEAHSRFDAVSRKYIYRIHTVKDPFLEEVSWYYPYRLDFLALQEAAQMLMSFSDFESFSKRNTQVHSFRCTLYESEWHQDGNTMQYHVRGNRFLRGMVRGLVATMMQIGRGKMAVGELEEIIRCKDNQRVDFSAPAHGLMLQEVQFPEV